MPGKTSESKPPARHREPRWLAIATFVLLCSLVTLRWSNLEARERGILRDKVKAEAEFFSEQMESDLRNRLSELQRVVGRWENRGDTPKEEFIADAEAYVADTGGLQAIEWADQGMVVRWIVPLEGNERALNMNLSFEKNRRSALEKAKALKLPTMTPPVDLVQGGKGFLIYLPIFVRDDFRGFVLATFRIQEWIDLVFWDGEDRKAGDFRIAVTLDEIPVYRQGAWEELQRADLGSISYVRILDRRFEISVQPTAAFIQRSTSPLPLLTAGVGLILSILIASIVYLFQNARAEAAAIEASRKALEKEMQEREKAEEALKSSEERFRLLLDSTAEAIYGIDLEGDCSFANPACLRMLGYADATLMIGKNMHSLIHHSYPDGRPMPVEECHIYRAFRNASREHREDEVLWRADGTSFPVEYWSYPQIVGGEVVGAVVAFIDITDRKRAAEALAAASRELELRIEERTRSLTEAHEKLMERMLLQHDLETAGQVQSSLMTAVLPENEGFDFASRARPSRYVNGDFYDCQLVDETYCSIILADIAGKGLPAALFASSARALYRLALNESCGSTIEETSSPGAILRLLNSQMLPDLDVAERFITMIAARLDLHSGLLEIANAGGCKLIVFGEPGCASRTLESGGFPVGLFPDLAMKTETLGLRPGMGALIYSDGLTEAANPADELFGLQRLLEATTAYSRMSAEDMASAILQAVEDFLEGRPLADDATFVVIKAKPRRSSFDLVSSLVCLDEMPARIAYLCSSYGEELARDMELATSEALANIRGHGYGGEEGPLSLDLRLETRGVELLIKEKGAAFDPEAVPPLSPGGLEEGGRGLFLIREAMDCFSYQPGGADGNLWILFRSTRA